MSSAPVHALVGAVGGMALARLGAVMPIPEAIPGLLGDGRMLAPGGVLVILVSAVLALWPDLDEPSSMIARRAPWGGGALGAAIAAGFSAAMEQSAPMEALLLLAGLSAGALAGSVAPRAIRRIAGGHRRGTHSLATAGVLLLLALGLAPFSALALAPAALAWGIALHVLADVVTPGGVALFYPLWRRPIRLLPGRLARYGEIGIATLAIIAGIALL